MVEIVSANISNGTLSVKYSYNYRLNSAHLYRRGSGSVVFPSKFEDTIEWVHYDISAWIEGEYTCYLSCLDAWDDSVYSVDFTVIISPDSATLTVDPTSITVTNTSQNEVQVNYTCDKTLTNVEISFDNGTSYNAKKSMTQTNAIFDISGKGNATYNCKLRGTYTDSTPVYGDVVTDIEGVSILMSSNKETYTIGVKLDKAPTTNQTITIEKHNASDSGFEIESGASMTFTPSNWNSYKYTIIKAYYWIVPTGEYRHLSIKNPNGKGKLISFYRP